MNPVGEIKDHQARVIEVESWDAYVEAIKNYNGEAIEFKSLTNLVGNTINRIMMVEELEYDKRHLSCKIYNNNLFYTKLLAYVC